MKRRNFAVILIAAVVVLCAAGGSAGAAVTIQSAEMASGSGSFSAPFGGTPTVRPTTYDPSTPFPNDTENFAGVGPDGLRVVVNRTALFTHHRGNTLSDFWTAHRFNVVFQLDEPAPFTYHRAFAGTDDSFAVITLQAQGQPPIQPLPLFGDLTGTLPPGLYTFSGVIDFQSRAPAEGPDFAGSGGFNDLTLTVAPEPGAVMFVAASLICLCERPARRARGGGK